MVGAEDLPGLIITWKGSWTVYTGTHRSSQLHTAPPVHPSMLHFRRSSSISFRSTPLVNIADFSMCVTGVTLAYTTHSPKLEQQRRRSTVYAIFRIDKAEDSGQR